MTDTPGSSHEARARPAIVTGRGVILRPDGSVKAHFVLRGEAVAKQEEGSHGSHTPDTGS